MKRVIIILGLAGLVLTAVTDAAPTINCEVTVREKTAGTEGDFVLIEKKQIPVVDGVKNTSFVVNFTLDMTVSYNDSGYFDCEVSVFTLGPQAQTFFKKFQSQPGGVYFLNNVRGKEDIEYRVGICPVSIDSAKTSREDCDFDFRRDGVWNFDPSANFDFYFVPQSLADARWNLLRDFMEKNYKDFKELFQLSFPGKINCFLSPCVLPQVNWDSRMGYAIDPPRSNCFVLYSYDHNTVDPIPAYLLRIYRYMGYAPPLLAEGMAAYFEFPHHYAKDLRQASQLPPIAMLLKSVDYYSMTGHVNISAASSFVKYLIDTYGMSQFRQLYKASSDLTVGDQFPAVYEKSLDALEAEWHHCLDTVTFPYGIYQYFYERDLYISRDPGMDEFLPILKARMKSYNDSLYVYSQEGWNQYMRGDYETARADYETLIGLAPTKPDYLIIYGNLLLIDGRYDSARVMFNRVAAVDSTVRTVLNKIGETYFWEKKLDSAQAYLERDMVEDPSQLSQASSGILLGEMALASGDRTAAEDYFNRALAAIEQIYQSGKTWPAYLLRLGQAHLGLAMCGESSLATAKSYLESALYFEVHPTRAIFVTRILKELGRIADLEGKRQEAISYYQQALKYPLPPGLEAEVRQYVVTPFAGYKP